MSRTPAGSDVAGTARPSIDAARKRLGGRPGGPSTRQPGTVVQATLRDGTRYAGVVLWSCREHCDLWFDDGHARRTRQDMIAPYTGPVPDHLSRVAAETRLFASLAEGDLVRWERPTGVASGCIVEKCRYGAIVVTSAGKLVAVGFRKLWPAMVRALA